MRTWIPRLHGHQGTKFQNERLSSLTYDVKSPNTLKYTTLHEVPNPQVSSSLLSLIVHSIKINSIE